MKIAVIIPFYQREAGLLSEALRSVFLQDIPESYSVRIYVVDDESPFPASSEIDALPTDCAKNITLLRQPNGGPGVARNLALDKIARDGADYVSFLDSDDIWHPRHLREAVSALEAGYDYYFCDHTRFNAEATYSSSIESLSEMRTAGTERFKTISSNGPVLAVESEVAVRAMIKDYLSQTSTVVIRHSFIGKLRFRPELRGAGEDHFFWICLLSKGARVAISWQVNVHCGRGINIYHSAFDFSSVQSTDRIGYLLLFRQKCLELPLDDFCSNTVRQSVIRYRRAYSYMFVRAWLIGQRPNMRLFRMLWREIPVLPLLMPFRFFAVLPKRSKESNKW